MIPGNCEQILQMISRNSGLTIEELERKIEAKRAKLSGLISKEGAAQIIAAELGISFDKHKLKISELLTGMKKINLVGKILKINRVIEYNKNERKGKIGSFLLADETSNIRVVLWDTNHISLIETGAIKEGDSIELSGADIRNGEIHLSGFADVKKSTAVIEGVIEKKVVHSKSISEINVNDDVSVRAFVVQIFGPTFFSVCPECGKKVSVIDECQQHGKVISKKKAILNFILDDGTGTIRSTLFDEQVKKIASESEIENSLNFMPKREEILGKEYFIEASARKNKLYENTELIVNDLREINIDQLIEELESKP